MACFAGWMAALGRLGTDHQIICCCTLLLGWAAIRARTQRSARRAAHHAGATLTRPCPSSAALCLRTGRASRSGWTWWWASWHGRRRAPSRSRRPRGARRPPRRCAGRALAYLAGGQQGVRSHISVLCCAAVHGSRARCGSVMRCGATHGPTGRRIQTGLRVELQLACWLVCMASSWMVRTLCACVCTHTRCARMCSRGWRLLAAGALDAPGLEPAAATAVSAGNVGAGWRRQLPDSVCRPSWRCRCRCRCRPAGRQATQLRHAFLRDRGLGRCHVPGCIERHQRQVRPVCSCARATGLPTPCCGHVPCCCVPHPVPASRLCLDAGRPACCNLRCCCCCFFTSPAFGLDPQCPPAVQPACKHAGPGPGPRATRPRPGTTWPHSSSPQAQAALRSRHGWHLHHLGLGLRGSAAAAPRTTPDGLLPARHRAQACGHRPFSSQAPGVQEECSRQRQYAQPARRRQHTAGQPQAVPAGLGVGGGLAGRRRWQQRRAGELGRHVDDGR